MSFEVNVRRALIVSGGKLDIFVERPISLAFLLIFVVLMFSPLLKKLYRKCRAKKA